MKKTDIGVFIVALLLIFGLDALTNSINTSDNKWDFMYYIALAKDGFNAKPLASPFAYRFLIPGLVHLLSKTGLSIESGFKLIAYLGAFAQLVGIFYFVRWGTKSERGAWMALFVTAFSFFNIKFLVFDPFRPDHLAYAFILLQTYFAFERKFITLLLLTLIGATMREFTLIPLAAYLFMVSREKEMRTVAIKQALISGIVILPAVLLPRILLPVTEDFQLIGFTPEKLLNVFILPFIPSFPVNFIFSVIAYFLPILLLTNLKDVKITFYEILSDQRNYFLAYTVLVLLLSFYGGTDFNRFASFLFLSQILLIGILSPTISNRSFAFTLLCLFIFNRLWMPIPDWNVESYRDYYGGFALQLNISTLYRILELTGFIFIGFISKKTTLFSQKQQPL